MMLLPGSDPERLRLPHGVSGDLLMDLDPDVGREMGPLWIRSATLVQP
jgi:hypothetical protein